MDESQGTAAARVFDALGADYERAFADSAAHHASLGRLLEGLVPHSRVLDVGCGTGRPTAQVLTDAGHDVLGVDVSSVMVDLASRQVPAATFVRADVRELLLEEASFDAVCVFFSLLQMTREEQSGLLRRLARALRPGGHLVIATVPLDVEGVTVTFMGQEVRATSFGPDAFAAMVENAGFAVDSRDSAVFTPAHEGAAAEPQVFLHGRRI